MDYIGIDVHRMESQICILPQDRVRLEQLGRHLLRPPLAQTVCASGDGHVLRGWHVGGPKHHRVAGGVCRRNPRLPPWSRSRASRRRVPGDNARAGMVPAGV